MERIESLILKNLIHNQQYMRKVFPFLKPEYFADNSEQVIFNEISSFINRYNECPTIDALTIQISNSSVPEHIYDDIESKVTELHTFEQSNLDWLMDQTEKFCKDKSVYNAILRSIQIIDGKDKTMAEDGIPGILQEALAVCFDTNIGHSYLDDIDSRWDFYHRDETRVPFDIDLLNKITGGGLPNKILAILLAGCVHPETKIRVNLYKRGFEHMWIDKEISIGEVKRLLDEGYEIEVDSPDGYVPVTMFVDKGEWDEYVLRLDSGSIVKVNENHLFETALGWQYAKDLSMLPEQYYLTKEGYVSGTVVRTGKKIPIVDINVNHENHRYYTNGVSSHNTGVGKSLVMCHMSAAALAAGKNVLYITMEMAEERIAERIDANLLNISLQELKDIPKQMFHTRIDKIRDKTHGNLIIKEYPTAAAHSGHFESLLNELSLKKNFVPDIIFIDYLNICASSRYRAGNMVNSYTLVKAIAEELRGLAVKYDVPIVSATQVNRDGLNSSDIDLTNTSESMGLPATCDLMLALISTEELENQGQLMIKQLKNRFGDPNMYKRFVVGVDRSKMKLYNLDISNQQDISDTGIPPDDLNKPKSRTKAKDFSSINV